MADYFNPNHVPNARTFKDLYRGAYEGLLLPPESVKFSRFTKMNQVLGGLRPHEFTILCGSTGAGKTTLCANISADLAESEIPHFVASVETGPEDYLRRIMSVFAREDLNSGDPIPVEKAKKLHNEKGHILQSENQWLSLYDNRVNLDTLIADLAYMVKVHQVKVAILDNLNFFLDLMNAQNDIKEMDRVIHELIIFCKHVPLHIIMVMHPKKTDHGRVESEFDIKGSSTAVQEAQNILLFNRPHETLLENRTATPLSRELKIAKMRRRGKYVGYRLILNSKDGTHYTEGDVVR